MRSRNVVTVAAEPAPPGTYVSPENPRLKLFSTLAICAGCLLVGFMMPTGTSELSTYKFCSYALLATLVIAFGIESIGGMRSLIRVDIVAISTLYFLTFAEFLHPRVRLLYDQATGGAGFACQLVLIGIAFLAVGRHINLIPRTAPRRQTKRIALPEISSRAMIGMFFLFAFLGYFYVLLTTNFNILEILSQLLQPRFARPWQRGAEGDWRSFLTELNLLLYLVAALGGYIYANASQFSRVKRIAVTAILLFMLFFDMAEGARNVVLIKLGLFLVTFFIASKKIRSGRIVVMSLTGMAALWMISGYMLDFRNQGLGKYITEGSQTTGMDSFMIDNNMVSIARVVEVFPETYPYPGSDVVIQVFTKWIPRALWPGKPVSWANSIESALNAEGYTIAVTYVGEAYLIAGIPSVIIASLLLGALAGAWTRVGIAARTNLDLIYYASGFFAATLGMRSIQFISIAIVPTVAFYIFGRYLASRQPRYRTRIAT